MAKLVISKAKCLCRLEIYDQVETRWLLNRQITRFRTLENFVCKIGRPALPGRSERHRLGGGEDVVEGGEAGVGPAEEGRPLLGDAPPALGLRLVGPTCPVLGNVHGPHLAAAGGPGGGRSAFACAQPERQKRLSGGTTEGAG